MAESCVEFDGKTLGVKVALRKRKNNHFKPEFEPLPKFKTFKGIFVKILSCRY